MDSVSPGHLCGQDDAVWQSEGWLWESTDLQLQTCLYSLLLSVVAGNSCGFFPPFSSCKVSKVLLAFLLGLEDKFVNICETSDTLVTGATEKPMRKLIIRSSEQCKDVMQ